MGVLGGSALGGAALAEGLLDVAQPVGLSMGAVLSAHGRAVLTGLSMSPRVGTMGISVSAWPRGLTMAAAVGGGPAVADLAGLSVGVGLGGVAVADPSGVSMGVEVGELGIAMSVEPTGLVMASRLGTVPLAWPVGLVMAGAVGGGPAVADLVGLEMAAELSAA